MTVPGVTGRPDNCAPAVSGKLENVNFGKRPNTRTDVCHVIMLRQHAEDSLSAPVKRLDAGCGCSVGLEGIKDNRPVIIT